MPRRAPIPFALSLLALVALVPPPAARASVPVTLPDTGLFEPVARQYHAELERLGALPAPAARIDSVHLLLATGRPDEAARVAAGLPQSQPRRADWWRGRVMLARQEFAPLEPIVGRIAERGDRATPLERGLAYGWLVARDDGARLDSLTRARIVAAAADSVVVPELLAAGKLAWDRLDYPRAESLFTRALAVSPANPSRPAWGDEPAARRALALTGLALVQQKLRQWDRSLGTLREALAADGSHDVLMALTESLIRTGRTDEAISAAEWAVRLAPYDDAAHYLLGNGYARKSYTQLLRAYPAAFADAVGRAAIARADGLLAAGRREAARDAYAAIVRAHPGWVDARVRLASLDFEDRRFEAARDGCFAALRTCPEYGRAHAVLARALEGQRFVIDVHRAEYEARFAAAPIPEIPGIERFVANWRSLSPRHQKRVALSMAPWKAYIPVLIAGGASYFIKPMYMLLSDCPDQHTLHDQRIDYDSRLWDDVRGCGGYHTVTGIEEVERTIFDRYNTVLHEFTHQVHAVLPADDSRAIQEHYRAAKARDDRTRDGYLSRYAGGSVYEYFAEGANALESPMRDAYDPREIVRERLDRIDPALRTLAEGFMARTDVSACYPVAYAAGGDDAVERGRIAEAVPRYRKALGSEPDNETALVSLARALVLGGRASEAESVAMRAVASHPASGPARVALAEARWHAGRPLAAVRDSLVAARDGVLPEDRHEVDVELGALAWNAGDANAALAAFDSVLAYQSDNPEGQQGRAAALALAGRSDEAFTEYDRAVRMRTGIVALRCDYARDLLGARRVREARAQLDAAALLDPHDPEAEALRGWDDLAEGRLGEARVHVRHALAWGPWCDLARIVEGGIEAKAGRAAAARAAWAPVERRIATGAPPGYAYRAELAQWRRVHALPAVERSLLARLGAAN